ncbi:MAG: porin [Hyphomonas sp.]
MPRSGLLTLALISFVPAAAAQDVWDDPGGIETSWSFEAAVIAAPFADEGFLGLANLEFSANYVLMNGAEIGVVGALEAQRDNPARAGFSGIFTPGGDPAALSGGAFSGLARGPLPEDRLDRISLETAYIYIDGGYGEARLGADEGVATRFYESGPALFAHAGLVNPALDPDGSIIARTDHDLTGPSVKLSYASPRILGLRAGLSYTPEAGRWGLDRDPVRAFGGLPRPEIENALEVALNLTRRLPQSGVRLRAGAAWSQADTAFDLQPGLYGKVETWSVGGSAEFSRLRIGASYLGSDNGIASGPGDYTAWSASASIPFGQFEAIGELAGAKDRFADLKSDSWQLGLAWMPEPGWRIAGGWRNVDTRILGALQTTSPRGRRDGIVMEITRSL